MRIDAHQHFWSIARGDYGWLTPESGRIYRDFQPSHLRPLLDAAGVDASILVQAAPTAAETDYLLSLAAGLDWVLGVVGWTDFEAETAADIVRALSKMKKLVGLRPMLQDIEETDWILLPEMQSALSAMVETELVFDALVQQRHLHNLIVTADRHPNLKIVVDHAGKPAIAQHEISTWARDMRMLAATTGVYCKLSGLVTEAGGDWTVASLKPYVDVLLETFGPGRLIWGSDWPVVDLASDYHRWFEATQELLGELSEQERADVLGGNAQAFYGV